MTRPRAASGAAEITAVVPCYNYGRFLPEVVASILGQEGVRARVVIVDDCSTDDSLSVARRLAAEDARVEVIAHEVNRGHIATYNDGLAAVTTEYVTLVSADDLAAPGAYGRATALMDAHPSVGMVYGRPFSFEGGDPTGPRWRRLPQTWTVWPGREWIGLASWRGRNFILSPEVVMRTAALREVGAYNPERPHSGDLEFWLRTASRWDVGHVNGRVQAYYRVHGANMHQAVYAGMPTDLRHRMQAFSYLASPDFAESSPKGARYLERVRRAMVREAVALTEQELDRGSIELARELLATAAELNGGPLTARQSRGMDARLARSGEESRVTPVQRARRLVVTGLVAAKWRFWSYAGVS
ncbi:glycosyltransferase family 2 protein [Leifsonia sp. 2MCAF36]|uniref:glycosyltransferase family 2 protein n=1 Tax=Leifsonia sp. 2MCAF36 TaxID=3232988 RepID=UPI003F9D0F42